MPTRLALFRPPTGAVYYAMKNKRHPFAKLINQGCPVTVFHHIGKAAVAGASREGQGWFYVAKYGQHHAEGSSPEDAITNVRAARAQWQDSENERLGFADLLAAGFTQPQAEAFCTYNQIGQRFFYTRAELRRVVTLPEYKPHNRATWGKLLATLGIYLGKPKP